MRATFVQSLLTALLIASSLSAADWPQILGPNRNGVSGTEELASKWATAPKQLWRKAVGSGWAGPAVVGQNVILFHRIGRNEVVSCFNAASGKETWKTEFLATYRGGINPDTGPRCVPIIHKNRIYVLGAGGDIHCLQLAGGKKVWTRNAYADYRGREGYFGAGSTPIIVGDHLIANIGGRPGAGLVAFKLSNGKTAWKATEEGASYSSPTTTKVDGKDVVVFVTRLNTVGIDPVSGKVFFRMRFGSPGPTVNAATPLIFGNHLFLSASYGIGCLTAKMSTTAKPKIVWKNDQTMSSQYTTCVYRAGYLYGLHGRQDTSFDIAKLRCVDAKTGEVKWSVNDFGVAHTILAKKNMLVLTDSGKLILVQPSPTAYKKLGSAQISKGTTRALPALSNGRLFVRVNGGGRGELISLQVGK